jgi:uncharacterized membrane protein
MRRPDPSRRSKDSAAGGVLLAVGAMVGAVVGYLWDQPSLGLVLGLGAGAMAAVAVWVGDRRR